jgi:hypothetical protein
MPRHPARSTYAKIVGDVAINWNVLERRLNSLIFHYLTVEAEVAGFVLGEMGNVTKERFAKFLVERYEKNKELKAAGLFAVQLFNRLRENRNTLEHGVPHLSHDQRYLGLVGKADRRGYAVWHPAPIEQLIELVDSMKSADSWMRLLSTTLHMVETDDGERHKGGPTWGEASVRAFVKLKRPPLPHRISPSEVKAVPARQS